MFLWRCLGFHDGHRHGRGTDKGGTDLLAEARFGGERNGGDSEHEGCKAQKRLHGAVLEAPRALSPRGSTVHVPAACSFDHALSDSITKAA